MKYTANISIKQCAACSEDLIEKEFDRLANTLYSHTIEEVLVYLDTISHIFLEK
jgi:hypothetical protein